MAWIRIDDHFDEHPKMARVGPLGWGVWLAGLAYCNRNLTDGFIPWEKARTLCSFEIVDDEGRITELAATSGMAGNTVDMDFAIDVLVRVGIWKVVKQRGRIAGFQVHDYEHYQPTKAEVLAERAAKTSRQKRWRGRFANRAGVDNGVDASTGASVVGTVDALVTTAPTPTPRREQITDASNVRLVFDHWVTQTHRDPAKTRLTKERESKINARLVRFSVEDLKRAVDGVMRSDFHRSKPEYTDLTSCFGNDSKVEQHIEHASPNGGASVDDVRRCLRLGGSMLSVSAGREVGFQKIQAEDAELWSRIEPSHQRIDWGYLAGLNDFQLSRAIKSELEKR